MSNRVLITGLNIITPLGLDLESSWAGIIAGKNGVGPITIIDTEGLQTHIAAQLPDSFDSYSAGFIKKILSSWPGVQTPGKLAFF